MLKNRCDRHLTMVYSGLLQLAVVGEMRHVRDQLDPILPHKTAERAQTLFMTL
jgi:hypothetical protein